MPSNRIRDLGTLATGTDEVQTLTIGGTPTGGTFKIRFESVSSAAITWSATTNTILANINAALDLHPSLGVGGCVATAGTISSGIGTVTLTFGAARGKENVDLMTIGANSLTGTSPTLAIANTTPGVNATGRYAAKGDLGVDGDGVVYVNTATAGPLATWTVVGGQT